MSSMTDEFDELLNDGDDDYLLALSLQAFDEDLYSNENKTKSQNIESDYELALHLSQLDDVKNEDIIEDKNNISDLNIVSPQLELSDPSPDIWRLMKQFDNRFFSGVLAKHCIELSWSPRMTRTAGLCAWNPKTNYCSIRLSLPLLQLRSRKDLVETLIHEMIHALLFVTKTDDNHESHGPIFHEHMYRINKESGTNITVYHDFHAEVNHYLKHVWRCEGICRSKAPYFGYVRRSMNRKPGPHDYWFKYHATTCGGVFTKISEPEKKKEAPIPEKLNNKDIRDFISPNKNKVIESTESLLKIVPFSGFGHKLGSDKSISNSVKNFKRKEVPTPEKLNNHDIRNFFSPKTNQAIKATNNVPNKSKIVPFSGFGPELGSNKSSHNSKNNKPSIQPVLQTDSFKRIDTNIYDSESTKVKKMKKVSAVGNSSTVSNTITNISSTSINSMPKSNANVRTISSFGSSEESISATFTPFCGKGNVLGTIKSEKYLIKPNDSPAQKYKPTDSKSSTFNKNVIKENIEVIELD